MSGSDIVAHHLRNLSSNEDSCVEQLVCRMKTLTRIQHICKTSYIMEVPLSDIPNLRYAGKH